MVQNLHLCRKAYHLDHNKKPELIKSITHISFPALKYLSIWGNEISSIEPIARVEMPNLQTIYFCTYATNKLITTLFQSEFSGKQSGPPFNAPTYVQVFLFIQQPSLMAINLKKKNMLYLRYLYMLPALIWAKKILNLNSRIIYFLQKVECT